MGFRLRGSDSNLDAIGAKITLMIETAGGSRAETRFVKGATGYASQNQLGVVFGLGPAGRATEAVIAWPSGAATTVESPTPRQVHRIEEASR